MAPSAVCIMLMPSLRLRTAMFRPRIWEVMFWPMARPAASSLAEFTRVPVESCSMAVLIERALVFIAFCEYIALTFVLITDIHVLQDGAKN